MDLSVERQRVAKALRGLESAIGDLVDVLAHSRARAEVDTSSRENPLRTICEAYSAIDYRMEDDIGTSVVCLGVVGATAEILRRAKAVNLSKARLENDLCTVEWHSHAGPCQRRRLPTKAIPVIRVILRAIQRSDLNLLAAYRKIPTLDAPPSSVTFTRANTRAVYRKSIDEVADMLSKADGPSAAIDRALLGTLRKHETHLALVKERYQNVRANVLYAHLDPRGRGRIQIAAELPVMYPTGRRHVAPQVTFPYQPIHPPKPCGPTGKTRS